MKANKEQLNIIKDFFINKLWKDDISTFSFTKRHYYKLLRCLTFTINRYIEDKSMIKASALTYYTLMSIVPLLALILGVARGFGLDDILENELRNNMLTMGNSIEKVFEFAKNMIANAKGGMFTGLGFGILLYAVIKGLGNIENSFNGIWGVRKKRSVARQFSDYMSVMIMMPVFLIALSGINVFVVATMENLGAEYSMFGSISPYIVQLMKLLPYVIIWILFVFLYIFIPNTKVKFKPALISGIIIGTLVQLLQWVYIKFQIGVASYNAIYGSFAAIPLLLIWIQMSWSLVLLGAQMCYYMQNIDGIDGVSEEGYVSVRSNRILLIVLLHRIVMLFKNGENAEGMNDLSRNINIKYSHVLRGIETLLTCNLIVEVNKEDDNVYLPAIDINSLTIADVMKKIDSYGESFDYKVTGLGDDFSTRWEVRYDSMITEHMGDRLLIDVEKML